MKEFEALVDRCWWLVGERNGRMPRTTIGYKQKIGKGFKNNYYPYGCNGNSRHHGVDVGGAKSYAQGMPIFAWGRGYVRFNSYDPTGYRRFLGLYYPSVDKSVDIGHLLNGSVQVRVGGWFDPGQFLARIGTKKDGILNSHVHIRCASGNFGKHAISPCKDEHPIITWRQLGLPA